MSTYATRLRVLSVLLWSFVFVFFAATAGRNPNVGDASLMCRAAGSVWLGDGFAVDPGRGELEVGPDGRHYVKYPLLPVLQCVPALLLHATARAWWPKVPELGSLALSLVPNALAATLALGTFRLALALGTSSGVGLLVALAVTCSTPQWCAARSLYSETLQAALVVWTLLMIVRSRAPRALGAALCAGLLCGLALNAKILLLCLPLVWVVDQAFERARPSQIIRNSLASVPGLLAGVLAFAWYNQLRFGHPLAQGYGTQRDGVIGFGTPFAVGLYGLLFSSGKSVFLYAPLTLASLWGLPIWLRERRRDVVLLLVPVLATIVIVSKWWAWHGDWAWGPRLLTPILPLMCLPASALLARPGLARRVTLLLMAAGLCVQLLGMSVDPGRFMSVVSRATRTLSAPNAKSGRDDHLRDELLPLHFVPEFSPITGQYWLLRRYIAKKYQSDLKDIALDYPWHGLGIAGFRPHGEPAPEQLDYWFWGSRSALPVRVECGLVLLSVGLALGLWWTHRRHGAARTPEQGVRLSGR